MAADNHTTIVGNLVDDPELRFTQNGIAVANLRVAVTQRIQQDGEWRDRDTSFLKVNVWRARPSTWPTPFPRATGSWSPADSANAAGKPPRARSGRWPRSRPMRSGPA
jgi:hypothetical protein